MIKEQISPIMLANQRDELALNIFTVFGILYNNFELVISYMYLITRPHP